jgi:hypothetical protein
MNEINDEAKPPATTATTRKSRKPLYALVSFIAFVSLFWFVVRPGVFTIQPIGALPEGVTLIYHSRKPEMPVFSSPDGLCLQIQGSVNLICRAATLSAAEELADRIIVRLPYSHWAYLRSTDGQEFTR